MSDISETQTSDTNATIKTPSSSNSSHATEEAMAEETRITSSVPWKGSTYIIRDSKTGEVLTLLDGEVILEKPGDRGHIKWDRVENGGWLGFKNPISGKYIGEEKGRLECIVKHHQWCEHFIARPAPEGGYLLLMRQGGRWCDGFGETLRVIRLNRFGSKNGLVKDSGGGIVWDFVKV